MSSLTTQIIRAHLAAPHLTRRELAERVGCSYETVRQTCWIKRLEPPKRATQPPRRGRRPGAEELQRLRVEERLSQKEIARRFDVAPQTVAIWIRQAGLPRPPHLFEVIARLHREQPQLTRRELAAAARCSYTRVRQACRQLGLSPPSLRGGARKGPNYEAVYGRAAA